MPFANFIRVREVSSEDNVHFAKNLVKSQSGKKWKTKNTGEKSAYVILEMSESQQITGIDIGNEHSAFVEVLVGKSTCASKDFSEILITCSFMTSTESKSSNNTNRVRCFNREALVPTVCDNKWSLVKVLCTQPFNKHVQYGLSFIKVHINGNEKQNPIYTQTNLPTPEVLNNTVQVTNRLKFREKSLDSESEMNSSSLFNRWKRDKDNDVDQTAAASIRLASKTPRALIPQPNDVREPQISQSNLEKLESLSEQIELREEGRRIEKEKEVNSKNIRKFLDVKRSIAPQNSSCNRISKKRQSSPPENSAKRIKPLKKLMSFNQLLKGVVLVISGIQNPDRGDLRNKAIALGAIYKTDWDSTCTHLICAFKNTPKYNQVKGKGKIVTRSWIENCYTTNKYLPWRRYALDSTEVSKPESDEEILEDTQEPLSDDTLLRKYTEKGSKDKIHPSKTLRLTVNDSCSSTESDTDDEMRRIKQKTNIVKKANVATKTLDVYEASTDEEDYMKDKFYPK